MILPTKHVKAEDSLLGLGALLLDALDSPKTVSRLWERVRDRPFQTFDRFVLTLGFLYTIGAVHREAGLLRRGPE